MPEEEPMNQGGYAAGQQAMLFPTAFTTLESYSFGKVPGACVNVDVSFHADVTDGHAALRCIGYVAY